MVKSLKELIKQETIFIIVRKFSVFKKIVDFKPGQESPKVCVEEHTFLLHNAKFKDSLNLINSTYEEQNSLKMVAVNKLTRNESLTTTDIMDSVSSTILMDKNDMVKENITRFCDSVLPVVKKIPIKHYWEKNFCSGMGNQTSSYFTSLNQQVNVNKGLNVWKNPHLNDGVSRFINHLDDTADRLLESINLLIEFSKINEVLTFLCSNQLLAKGLGLNLFFLLYLGNCDSFTFFLLKVHVHLEKLITPLYNYVKIKFYLIYKDKRILGETFSGLGRIVFDLKSFCCDPLERIPPRKISWVPKKRSIVK